MKLIAMTFQDDNGEPYPETATVEMTLAEVAAIARVFGALNGYAHDRLGLDDSGIYDALTGGVLNRYWEDGVNDILPRFDLLTINNAPE